MYSTHAKSLLARRTIGRPFVASASLSLALATAHADWVPTAGPIVADLRGIFVQGGRLYAGTRAGIYVSANRGAIWMSANSGVPANTTINAFGVAGDMARTLLIRGVGPSLAPRGITGAPADPLLELYSQATGLHENDDGTAATSTHNEIFARVGAFSINSGSKDVAMVVTLPPGPYTVMVRGGNGTMGVALAEIHEVP